MYLARKVDVMYICARLGRLEVMHMCARLGKLEVMYMCARPRNVRDHVYVC